MEAPSFTVQQKVLQLVLRINTLEP
jgi:hypothetical protein